MPPHFLGTVTKRAVTCAFLFTLTLLSPLYAQEKGYLPFYSSDTTRVYELAVTLRTSLKNHFVVPTDVSAAYRNSYNEVVAKAAESSYWRARNYALLDQTVDPYIQAIFKEVVEADSDLPETRLVLTRSPVENAHAQADGTVFFNIGLLAKMDNESQVAFIICHELAHIKLKHMERGIKESLDAFYSKSFKQQLKQTAREKYNKRAKMEALFGEFTLQKLYHKRSYEKQADSLGYILLSKTKYNTADAYTTLQLLDKIDEPYSSQELDFNTLFSCSDSKFKFESKPKTSSIFDVSDTEPAFSDNPDTLKTHPDCQVRMRSIQELQPAVAAQRNSPINHYLIPDRIRIISRNEVVQTYFDTKNYDYALFYALLLLKDQPDNAYLKNIAMLCLYELKNHLQMHRFAEVVSVESSYQPDNFNQLLQVLHHLNISDFKGISSCFSQAMQTEQETNEYAMAALYASAVLREDTTVAEEIKKAYLAKYIQGRFAKKLFPTSLK